MSASLYDRVSYDELGGLMKLLFSGLNSNEGTTSNNQHSQRLRRLTQLEQAHLRRLAAQREAEDNWARNKVAEERELRAVRQKRGQLQTERALAIEDAKMVARLERAMKLEQLERRQKANAAGLKKMEEKKKAALEEELQKEASVRSFWDSAARKEAERAEREQLLQEATEAAVRRLEASVKVQALARASAARAEAALRRAVRCEALQELSAEIIQSAARRRLAKKRVARRRKARRKKNGQRGSGKGAAGAGAAGGGAAGGATGAVLASDGWDHLRSLLKQHRLTEHAGHLEGLGLRSVTDVAAASEETLRGGHLSMIKVKKLKSLAVTAATALEEERALANGESFGKAAAKAAAAVGGGPATNKEKKKKKAVQARASLRP
jgi:hypothetical protein